MKRISKIYKTLPFIIILLFIIQILLTNNLATSGKKVQSMEGTIAALTEENEELRSQVAAASSMLTIEEKAKALGFTHTPPYVTIGQEVFALSK